MQDEEYDYLRERALIEAEHQYQQELAFSEIFELKPAKIEVTKLLIKQE